MLTHLEFEQIKRALHHMKSETESRNSYGPANVPRESVLDLLKTFAEGYKAPDPNAPPVDPAVTT